MTSDYKNYKAEDLIIDNSFKKWVLDPDRDSNVFWEEWISHNSDKIYEVRKARDILLNISRVKFRPSDEFINNTWESIHGELADDDPSKVIPLGPESIIGKYHDHKFKRVRINYGIAASVSIIILTLLSYFLIDQLRGEKAAEVQPIEKSNPRGQKSTVFLPDGSKVFLNAESTISYGRYYNKTDRVVHLIGEGFFEVAEDSLRPFTVKTDRINTTALGTSFNVNTFDGTTEVCLVTGKVRVSLSGSDQEDILLPGQQAISDNEKRMVKRSFDPQRKTSWKDRTIYFDDTPFKEAINILERWYDVSVNVEGNPNYSELVCTGKFDDDYLSNVLISLGYSLNFDYQIKDKEVLITFKN